MFKKKKPFIRFYSIEPGVADLFPIYPANTFRRPWMLEKGTREDEKLGETKNCPGIRLVTSAGWIMPVPADFKIKTHGHTEEWEWASSTTFKDVASQEGTYITSHPYQQAKHVIPDDSKSINSVIKVDTPWRLEASDDILLLQMGVPYTKENRFTVATGLIDPQYTHNLNVQLIWHVVEGEEIVKAGTPLVQYIPVSRHMVQAGHFDSVIDTADQHDLQREHAFSYVQRSTFPGSSHDILKSRLQKIKQILDKYTRNRR